MYRLPSSSRFGLAPQDLTPAAGQVVGRPLQCQEHKCSLWSGSLRAFRFEGGGALGGAVENSIMSWPLGGCWGCLWPGPPPACVIHAEDSPPQHQIRNTRRVFSPPPVQAPLGMMLTLEDPDGKPHELWQCPQPTACVGSRIRGCVSELPASACSWHLGSLLRGPLISWRGQAAVWEWTLGGDWPLVGQGGAMAAAQGRGDSGLVLTQQVQMALYVWDRVSGEACMARWC